MRLKIGSILAMFFVVIALFIAVSNTDRLMEFGPSHPAEQQMQSAVIWAAICGLFAVAARLAISDSHSTNTRGTHHARSRDNSDSL